MGKMMEKIEITKSVAMKVNIGDYQTVDLFCSVKGEANGDAKEVAEKLHEFAKSQVVKDYNNSIKFLASQVSKEKKEELLSTEV